MRIVAHRGTRLHAPENSRQALISGYTARAEVIEMDVQMTKDGRLVVSHDGTTDRLTKEPGRILDMTLQELRHTSGPYDFSASFNPTGNDGFRYYRPGRRLQIEIFDELLDLLPRDVEKLIEFKHDSAPDALTRCRFVTTAINAIQNRNLTSRVVVYSKDRGVLKLARDLEPEIRLAAFDWELYGEAQVDLMLSTGADGLVTSIDTVIDEAGNLTQAGEKLRDACHDNELRVGAVLYPFRGAGVVTSFTESEYRALSQLDFIWSVSTDSMLGVEVESKYVDVARLASRPWTWIEESFEGTSVNRDLWAFGYAKAHASSDDNANVYQDDGVHIETKDYSGWLPPNTPSSHPTVARVEHLELRMLYAEMNWPFYTGGGVGLIVGIPGDFIAEVDYALERPLTQATTLEMAVVNADPGSHQSAPPASFRNKDSFFDPHGAPPFVGVEHDEDDGFRINWNLGYEYDNNQYGPPVGDGRTPTAGRLRLERRGAYFSAYYQNDQVGSARWICVGSARNESLNEVVYLRCAAKRWRQERADDPTQYWPIVSNHFVFRNLRIERF